MGGSDAFNEVASLLAIGGGAPALVDGQLSASWADVAHSSIADLVVAASVLNKGDGEGDGVTVENGEGAITDTEISECDGESNGDEAHDDFDAWDEDNGGEAVDGHNDSDTDIDFEDVRPMAEGLEESIINNATAVKNRLQDASPAVWTAYPEGTLHSPRPPRADFNHEPGVHW